MSATFRIGIVGMVHDHVWDVLKHFAEDERAVLAAAADPNQPLLDRIRTEYGVEACYTEYTQMLEREKLDAVIVYTDNVTGPFVVEAAAQQGVHAMVEKPIAARLDGAERAVLAARKHGTLLAVNWPTAWNRHFAHVVRLAAAGDIGQVFKVRYRAAHQGPKAFNVSEYFADWLYDARRNGAGALIDYCSYGSMYNAYLLGRPGSVTGVAGRFVDQEDPVDDNAVLLLKYENGLGICEASWSQWGFNYELLVNGTEGSLRSERETVYRVRRGSKQPECVEAPPLPAGQRNAADFFLSALEAGEVPEGPCSATVGRNAQEIMEAGLISAQTGSAVPLPVLTV